jgi:hypothetical protein
MKWGLDTFGTRQRFFLNDGSLHLGSSLEAVLLFQERGAGFE